MMDDPHKPSNGRDEDASAQLLSALLDGELSGSERREMLERLQSDPEEAERFAHYRAQRDALKALFPLPGAAPALFVQRRAPRRRAFAYAFAGLAAGLLIGVALPAGWLAIGRDPAFAARADVAYAVYAADRDHPVEVGAGDPAHLAAWLSARVGRPVRAPSLDEYGYVLLGGRLLPGDGGPAAQFMYQRADGARVTLYVTAYDARHLAPQSMSADGRYTYFWSDRGMGYALSGRGDERRLRALAIEACGALGGPTDAWKS
ncbi:MULTISPECIES: anti-sigma factor family protein [Burkholderia]|uniref:anti-sigma factor family protein n=1 Tax=Burkholderia TaxID=32008 RepID=UPI000756511B|nr:MULTISPECIES: anti-sigma factor [Burkholderia]AOJ24032.1 anti-sigma factor [Burkholderia seminalis]KVF50223.1 anti-sigma factor [Burkholderia seminalis]MBN3739997.1 anti-sigma factor [Burkholderia sp. Tr-20355]MCA8041661.1 anti-sigma factor [Burkholderia seminalis]MCA8301476.1 anti-sigma factor [Burkholderia seminalis]